MTARKRWAVALWPTASSRRFDSKAAAYRYVQRHREDRALGMTRITNVVVLVSEDRGPWQTYERIRFDAPTGVSS